MSAEAIAIVGVGVLAVPVPLIPAQGRRLEAPAADVAEVRRGLHAPAERVALIEGDLNRSLAAAGGRQPLPGSQPDLGHGSVIAWLPAARGEAPAE